jgi:hypothetical protein
LWLNEIDPGVLKNLPVIHARVAAVKAFREKSTAQPTRRAALFPSRFFFISQPAISCLAIPEVSSENRPYIPIGFIPPSVIASNKLYLIPTSSHLDFGVLSSAMHMAWVKTVSGRLESRFQYSGSMVYNTFPWPASATDAQRMKVEHSHPTAWP